MEILKERILSEGEYLGNGILLPVQAVGVMEGMVERSSPHVPRSIIAARLGSRWWRRNGCPISPR